MPIQAERRDRHEGPRAGAFAATAVWLWILIRDMHAGIPFSTPAFLGRGLLSVDGGGAGVPAIAGVIAFTIAHYAVWIGVGTLVVAAVRRAPHAPSILLGLVLLLILIHFLFLGVTGILAQSRLGPAAWYEMLIGDAIGWTVLGWYVYRRHHELRGELARAGRDEP